MQRGAGGSGPEGRMGCAASPHRPRPAHVPREVSLPPGILPPVPAPCPRTLALASASFSNILSHYDLSGLQRKKAQKSLEGV